MQKKLNLDSYLVIMKNILIILFSIFAHTPSFAQYDYRARLPIYGRFDEIGISREGDLWIATDAGNTYYTKNIDSIWHLGPFGSKDPYPLSSSGRFERINFFTENIMMISGSISPSQDFVYWSEDHGKSWCKVVFGKSSWIDAAYISNDGKAWMSGSSQLIYYTEDYGRTWQEFSKVEKKGNLRFISIHFAKDGMLGLFGSTWNVIYRTTDNCKTWEKIPTPLDQKKYKQLVGSNSDMPRINKIKVMPNYYIVNQKNRVFYTKPDEINWVQIPDAIDFDITEKRNIYIVNRDFTFSLLDSTLNPVWKSEQKIDQLPVINVQNENLYAITSNSVYKINPNKFVKNDLFTDEVSISEPSQIVKWDGENIGFEANDILKFDNSSKRWYRYMTLAEPIVNAAIYKDQLVIACTTLENRYTLNLDTKQISRFNFSDKLFSLSENPIVSFSIERGLLSDFYSEFKKDEYKRDEEYFIKQKSFESGLSLANKIPSEILIDITREIENFKNKKISIKDLNILDNDIEDYQSFITQKEDDIKNKKDNMPNFGSLYSFPGRDNPAVDFNFYRNKADSIKYLQDSLVYEILSRSYGNWSTTTDWSKITFFFKDSSRLTISNRNEKPNYLYNPWTIDYNGIKIKHSSLRLVELIDKLSEGKLLTNREVCSKKYAIFKIVDYLYRKSINYPL